MHALCTTCICTVVCRVYHECFKGGRSSNTSFFRPPVIKQSQRIKSTVISHLRNISKNPNRHYCSIRFQNILIDGLEIKIKLILETSLIHLSNFRVNFRILKNFNRDWNLMARIFKETKERLNFPRVPCTRKDFHLFRWLI